MTDLEDVLSHLWEPLDVVPAQVLVMSHLLMKAMRMNAMLSKVMMMLVNVKALMILVNRDLHTSIHSITEYALIRIVHNQFPKAVIT